jgi:hypothetical protein
VGSRGNTINISGEGKKLRSEEAIGLCGFISIFKTKTMKLLIFSILILSAFFTNAQNPGSIPDSIKSYTILVMKAEQGIMQKKYNRELEDALGKYYTGTFELVGKKDLEDAKYADLSKYRYTINYFQVGKYVMRDREANGHIKEREIGVYDVVFYDRVMKKDLNRPGIEESTYIGAMRKLSKMLEQKAK